MDLEPQALKLLVTRCIVWQCSGYGLVHYREFTAQWAFVQYGTVGIVVSIASTDNAAESSTLKGNV